MKSAQLIPDAVKNQQLLLSLAMGQRVLLVQAHGNVMLKQYRHLICVTPLPKISPGVMTFQGPVDQPNCRCEITAIDDPSTDP